MGDSDAEAVERWLDQLDPDDSTIRVYDLEGIGLAAKKLVDAVQAALARGVPAGVIAMATEMVADELSVLLRSGDTISLGQLRHDLDLHDDR